MLEIGLIGGRPAQQEAIGWRAALRQVIGVIVFDLMVVPGRQPGAGRVSRLQVGVAAIERMTPAIGLERLGHAGIMLAYKLAAPG